MMVPLRLVQSVATVKPDVSQTCVKLCSASFHRTSTPFSNAWSFSFSRSRSVIAALTIPLTELEHRDGGVTVGGGIQGTAA